MKPQRYAQRVAWAGNARQLGRLWRSYAALFAGAGGFVVVLALWPHMPLREGLIGFTLGVSGGMAFMSLLRLHDPQVCGDLAEQWSAEAFGKIRGWRITNGLSFPDGDLDHVVVTPAGVLAVETKYRFRQPDKRRLIAQRHKDLEAARRAAQKAARLLRSKEAGHPSTVTPVLMIWGPGAPDLPDSYAQVDSTYVLDGNHPELWSHLFNAPRLPPETRVAIHEALSRYQKKQLTWAEQHRDSLRAICWAEFLMGLREARDERRQLVAKRRASRRRHRHHAARTANCYRQESDDDPSPQSPSRSAQAAPRG